MDKRSSWIAAALLLLGSELAGAQGSQGAMAGFGVPYLIPPSVVELNEPQRRELASLRRELHGRYCELSLQAIDLQEELRAALGDEAEASARISKRIDALRKEARAARAAALKRAEALLDEEQRVTLARWRAGQRDGRGELDESPYTLMPGIKSDEPDIESLEEPELRPEY